ncbi:MAG: agmatine deiminase family protein [Gammaproteobacteria bacterium]|nr:agmatine deiminase family protein [Gammaproteobacteria bacterium]
MRRYPAEWEPQSGVQITWPHEHSDWQPWLTEVEPVFVEIARQVCRFQKLVVVCYDERHRKHVYHLLSNADIDTTRVSLYIIKSNDTWARDHGPVSVLENDQPLLLDFIFNGWGQKFEAGLDNNISHELASGNAFHQTSLQSIEMVVEGGGLETDGHGSLLTTTTCQLSPYRNPQLDREQVEAAFHIHLGIERVLWLEHGHLEGDDTDSHIDTLARFADESTIVYVACDDSKDSHYHELKAMEAELQAFRRRNNEPYKLVALPWPRAIYNNEGERLPASYANYLIINRAVLVPLYNDPADKKALEILKACHPDREIIGINCRPLIYQFGSLHCVTMNYYAGIL